MNTSKILKKSLAMVLAVMMIVAMIPLSASAAATATVTPNGDDIYSLTTDTGVIEADGDNAWKVSLPYSATGNVTITVDPAKTTFDKTFQKGDKETDTYKETAAFKSIVIAAPAQGESTFATFYLIKDGVDDSKSAEYTINVETAKAVASAELEKVELTYWDAAAATPAAKTVEGTVDGQTAEVILPWGVKIADLGAAQSAAADVNAADKYFLAATLKYPSATSPVVITTATVDSTSGNLVAKDVKARMQNDLDDYINVTVKPTDALTSLKLGDTAAVVDPTDATKYSVTLPVGTTLTTGTTLALAYTLNGEATKVEWGPDTVAKSGDKVKVENAGNYTLRFTDKNGAAATYTVAVAVTKNTEALVESFTATVDGFVAEGKVDGKTLSIELPSTAAGKAVSYEFKLSTGASITTKPNSLTAPASAGAPYTQAAAAAINAEKLVVTAEDTTTTTNYQLNATISETANNDPKVEALTFTIPGATSDKDVKIEGEINGLTITLKGIPYSTLTSVIQLPANYKLTLPSGVKEDSAAGTLAAGAAAATYEDGFKFGIISDGGQEKVYTVKFEKDAASTDKALNSIEFTQAAKEDKKTDENTYKGTVKGTVISIELPYSIYDDTSKTDLYLLLDISEKAGAIEGDETAAIGGIFESLGYDDKGDVEASTPIHGADIAAFVDNEEKLIVLDEIAVYTITEDAGKTYKKVADVLDDEDLAGHFTAYTFNVTRAAAKTGNKLKDLVDETGEATAKVSANTVALTLPESYAKNGYAVTVSADEMAKIVIGSDSVADGKSFMIQVANPTATDPKDYQFKYSLDDGSTWKDFDGSDKNEFEVESEIGGTNPYTISATINAAVSGAEITKLLVNEIEAEISGKTITAHVLEDADLTNLVVTGEKSKLADITPAMNAANKAAVAADAFKYDAGEITLAADNTFTLTVKAEDGSETNKYTVTVKADAEPEPENPYSDEIPSWALENALRANELGIITGIGGEFKSASSTTRAQFAVMMARLMGADEDALKASTTKSTYSDVEDGWWASWAIEYCKENGYMNGTGSGKFSPMVNVTREQAATIISRALKLTEKDENKFEDDAEIGQWYVDGVYTCKKAEIVNGTGGNKFTPKSDINRGSIATIVVRAYDYKEAHK